MTADAGRRLEEVRTLNLGTVEIQHAGNRPAEHQQGLSVTAVPYVKVVNS